MRSIKVLAAVVLCALALMSAPADAARRVIIRGGGWGHGIGMSQYGAYGRARQGAGAERILEHYYSNTNVTKGPVPGRIRVGLLQGRTSVSLKSSPFEPGGGKVVFKVAGNSATIAKGWAGSSWRVEASRTGGVKLFKNSKPVKKDGKIVFGGTNHPMTLRFDRFGTLIDVTDKPYNYAYGRMEFVTYKSSSCSPGYCMSLVVVLPMQKYLYGLGEVPASWPDAALKAQAIAGRTYASDKARRLGQHRYPCDCAVYDSTIDQAYIGDAKRTGSGQYWDDWKRAVDQTGGQVVVHSGAPIQALYSSSSGGHTEHNENVWGGTPLPYLRGVPDKPDDNPANPNHNWKVTMTWSAFSSKLNSAFGTGKLKRFEIVKPLGVSGRVTVVKSTRRGGVRIVGSAKTSRVSGWSIRSALGLKDTLFSVAVRRQVGRR